MSPVYGRRVRFPGGYSLELTGRGEILVYRTALRELVAVVTWSDAGARLYADSLEPSGGLLRYALRPHEREVVLRRMADFLGDSGRTPVHVDRGSATPAPGT